MEFSRSFGYCEGEPCLFVHRKIDSDNRKFAVGIKDLWHFSEEHNPIFLQEMHKFCVLALNHLGIADFHVLSKDMKTRYMAKLAQIVQEGIDDVIRMKPQEFEKKVIGEGKFTVGGKTHYFDVTDRD